LAGSSPFREGSVLLLDSTNSRMSVVCCIWVSVRLFYVPVALFKKQVDIFAYSLVDLVFNLFIFIFSRGIHWHFSKVLLLTILFILIVCHAMLVACELLDQINCNVLCPGLSRSQT
jgi:hypothetical protein